LTISLAPSTPSLNVPLRGGPLSSVSDTLVTEYRTSMCTRSRLSQGTSNPSRAVSVDTACRSAAVGWRKRSTTEPLACAGLAGPFGVETTFGSSDAGAAM
jgi:hypothetical protein